MSKETMAAATTSSSGRWAVLILFAAVPLTVSAIFIQFLGPVGSPLSDAELFELRRAYSAEPFVPGTMIYAGMVVIHLFICTAAILFSWFILRSVPRWKMLWLTGLGMASTIAILLLALAILGGDRILIYKLTYFVFKDLYIATGADASILEPRLFSFSVLGLAIYIPTVLGVFAVALVAAAATGQIMQLYQYADRGEEEQEAALCLIHSRAKHCVYVLSFVLVTSTVTAALFFQLPLKTYFSEDNIRCCFDGIGHAFQAAGTVTERNSTRIVVAARMRLDAFATELTMFWGAIYMLTLLAAAGVPMLLVQRRVRDFLDALKPHERAQGVRLRMTQLGVVVTGGEQMKLLLTFVAPLVSAPITSFLHVAAG